MKPVSGTVLTQYRIVPTVHIHIVPGGALAGGDVGVAIEESSDFGVIVTGVEVVEAGFGIVVVTSITEGVIIGDIGGKPGETCRYRGGDSAPGIVLVADEDCAVSVYDCRHVALEILHVVEGSACGTHLHRDVGDGAGFIVAVVEGVSQGLGAARRIVDQFAENGSSRHHVLVEDIPIHKLFGDPHAVGIVGVTVGAKRSEIVDGGKLSAPRPIQEQMPAPPPLQGIAEGIIGRGEAAGLLHASHTSLIHGLPREAVPRIGIDHGLQERPRRSHGIGIAPFLGQVIPCIVNKCLHEMLAETML